MADTYGSKEDIRKSRLVRAIMTAAILAAALLLVFLGTDEGKLSQLSAAYRTACAGTQSIPVPEDALVVHMIDVGQGDSFLVQSGGVNVLIDAGPQGAGKTVLEYLRAHGVTRLDRIVCTHMHDDHVGGMRVILDEYPAATILLPGQPDEPEQPDRLASMLLEHIAASGMTVERVRPDDVISLGGMTITVLWPDAAFSSKSPNDRSLALLFSVGECDFLACGDLSAECERMLAESRELPDIEIMKSTHHGSALSNSAELLSETRPEWALISCGADNDYGHPHDILLERYEQLGISWLRTDVSGSVTVICTEDGVTVQEQKQH